MIRSYTPDDESAMLSLWNTAGAVMGYAPVPLEDFHRLLTRHPNFSPAYTFVLEEKGTLLGFVNGCTGAGIPKGDIRGYLSCLILAAEADSDENTALLLSALENAFRKAGKTYCAVTFFNPIRLPWILPGTPGHQHNNAPGVATDLPLHDRMLSLGYRESTRECAMYRNLADYETPAWVEEKAAKMGKGDKKFLHEADVFKALAAHLDAGKSARTFEADSKEDAELIATADLLSLKPIIYAANMDEDGFADKDSNKYYKLVADLAAKEGAEVLPICAKLEQDIAELDGDDRAMFLEELGIEKSGLDRLIQCSYTLLGLISFLTYGEDECRAWTIVKGTKAPQAAGKIHSDIERGFIRAETINFSEMIACGSVAAAKEKGLLRSEGKDYVVKDGDMIYFRFNV
mgnify:CR=1 FL=1